MVICDLSVVGVGFVLEELQPGLSVAQHPRVLGFLCDHVVCLIWTKKDKKEEEITFQSLHNV